MEADEVDNTCSICLDPIGAGMFNSCCPTVPHRFHVDCIHDYAKACLANAVSVIDGVVRVKHCALARCPICRSEMTFAHRQQHVTKFFLIGGSQTLLELGSVRSTDQNVHITTRSYKPTQPMRAA